MNKFDQIIKEVKNIFENGAKSHDFDHTMRVYNMCMHIGKTENVNIEVLKLSAILHDIGREEERRTKGEICHAQVGAKISREILEKYNYEEELIGQVAHCIIAHRSRNNNVPQTMEAKILFDADKLDAIGAIGLARTFVFAGEIGAKVHNKDIDIENVEDYSEDDTAYKEFLLKHRYKKDKIYTDEGKRIAENRHNFMVNFFERLNKEVDGEL